MPRSEIAQGDLTEVKCVAAFMVLGLASLFLALAGIRVHRQEDQELTIYQLAIAAAFFVLFIFLLPPCCWRLCYRPCPGSEEGSPDERKPLLPRRASQSLVSLDVSADASPAATDHVDDRQASWFSTNSDVCSIDDASPATERVDHCITVDIHTPSSPSPVLSSTPGLDLSANSSVLPSTPPSALSSSAVDTPMMSSETFAAATRLGGSYCGRYYRLTDFEEEVTPSPRTGLPAGEEEVTPRRRLSL